MFDNKPPETNERGNQIYRDLAADAYLQIKQGEERYYYDFEVLTPKLGWKQYDTSQDAWYYGVWVNIEKRMTFCYAEGDRILCVCPDDEHLRAELADLERFHGDPPPAAIGIDADGKVTKFYDERPKV